MLDDEKIWNFGSRKKELTYTQPLKMNFRKIIMEINFVRTSILGDIISLSKIKDYTQTNNLFKTF
jgi:hypothetical protein